MGAESEILRFRAKQCQLVAFERPWEVTGQTTRRELYTTLPKQRP